MSVSVPVDAEFFGDAHKVGYRLDPYFMHHASTVDLDVLLSGSEVESDLLVQLSSNHMFHYLPLTRRETGETP